MKIEIREGRSLSIVLRAYWNHVLSSSYYYYQLSSPSPVMRRLLKWNYVFLLFKIISQIFFPHKNSALKILCRFMSRRIDAKFHWSWEKNWICTTKDVSLLLESIFFLLFFSVGARKWVYNFPSQTRLMKWKHR